MQLYIFYHDEKQKSACSALGFVHIAINGNPRYQMGNAKPQAE